MSTLDDTPNSDPTQPDVPSNGQQGESNFSQPAPEYAGTPYSPPYFAGQDYAGQAPSGVPPYSGNDSASYQFPNASYPAGYGSLPPAGQYGPTGASGTGLPYGTGQPYGAGGFPQDPRGQSSPSSPHSRRPLIVMAVVVLSALVVLVGVLIWWLLAGNDHSSGAKKGEKLQQDYASLIEKVKEGNSDIELNFVRSDVSDYPHVKLYLSLTREGAGRGTESDNNSYLELSSPTSAVKETLADGSMVERKIRKIERIENTEGVGYEILMDKSASMTFDMDQMKEALRDFINSLDYSVGDKAEVISFDTYLMYMSMFTGDKDLLLNGVDNMEPYGDTALYDALYTGVTNAGSRGGMNCVIAFTDGIDNSSIHTPDEVISLAQTQEIPIYLIGTSDADSYELRSIAQETEGEFWDIASISDMSDVLASINTVNKDTYVLEYDSDPDMDPYEQRSVSLVLADADNSSSPSRSSLVGGYLENYSFTPVKKEEKAKHSSRYELTQADISWTDANNMCIQKGGHLATVTSQAEEDKLSAMASGAGLKFIWLGGYTSVRNGDAFGHWVTGEDFRYSQWRAGEPSRNDRDGEPEFYLMMWNVDGQWSWNDQRDDVLSTGLSYFPGNIGYICEYESVK